MLLRLLAFISAAAALNTSTRVHLRSGTYIGERVANGSLTRWLGLPFAESPVGELRFRAPVPIRGGGGGGVHSATSFGDACPQPLDSGLGAPVSEDCLYLNVSGGGSRRRKLMWYDTGLASGNSKR